MKDKVIASINAFWAIVGAMVVGFSGVIERGNLSRKIMHFGTMYLTFDSYVWAKHFAETTSRTGLEVPGIIAAVLAAVSGLQGYVFKTFVGSSQQRVRTRESSSTHSETIEPSEK